MNIDKYIELLRFYLTEKISEINDTIKNSFDDEVNNIISSILSAIFAVFVSSEAIKADGFLATIAKIILVVVVWYVAKFVVWERYRKRKKADQETKASDKKELSPSKVKSLVDKFDHIACDGVLLSWDFLDKASDEWYCRSSEKEFYLIEAFYYYKKALLITEEVVYYAGSCVNNAKVCTGVARYRLENIYHSLVSISKEISELQKQNVCSMEFASELNQADRSLEKIKKFIEDSE